MSASGSGAGGSQPPPADDLLAHINLKVKSQEGEEVFFKIKKGTPLRKLINAYCDRTSKSPESVAFLFDGRRIRPEQTPHDLDMEDGDEIDAMLHQTGGDEIHFLWNNVHE
ncbi:small ubiquitin-related modifier 1-like [Neltuma alba]|uniref:small ubiquitin-related modifier 1-like n=1 Tax=Neltuma alba TaxID=207710 RepID=UPI0010A2FD5F|nr:small ubiquitin-related modifier 1-like [Prosopis alba]